MKELLKRVIDHDFYYRMSDDSRWYDKGLETESQLRDEVNKHDVDNIIIYLEELKKNIINLHKNKTL